MFIVFAGNNEVIITTVELETRCLREFFTRTGRDIEDYDREIISQDSAVHITAVPHIV